MNNIGAPGSGSNTEPFSMDRRPFSRVRVYGPAYLDRVLRVEGPLAGPGARPLDRGVDGSWGESDPDPDALDVLVLEAEDGRIPIRVPDELGWPDPRRHVLLDDALGLDPDKPPPLNRAVGWADDLGGMGAGFARALGGELVHALGDPDDPLSRAVVDLLVRRGVAHQPIRVVGVPADWTLLVTSGPHGDKLAIGFRGCHARLDEQSIAAARAAAGGPAVDCVVGAALANRVLRAALDAHPEAVRLLAPARRNMVDRAPALVEFADHIDAIACNRGEWELLPEPERDALADRVSLIAVTDGPAGARLRARDVEIAIPAFPRARPPADTNRAGEAFAATLVESLAEPLLARAPIALDRLEAAGLRASAAAALVLDSQWFGFPTPEAVDAALAAGVVH